VSLPASANFTVMGSNQYGCSGSAVVQVTVNPLPVITASPGALQYCTGDEAVLTAAGAATYSWNSGAAFLQTGNPLTITAVPASYTVRGTDVNGCVGTAFLALNVSECTSLREENSVFQVKIYPNPASNLVNVQSAGNSAAFHLFDLTGRALLKGTCTDGHGTFNVSDLPAGVYMFRLDDGSAPPVRIIKE